MIKNYLLRIILLCFLLLQFLNKASAQYAIGGTAGPGLYNAVYWLTWDPSAPGSTMITFPAGADAAHILNGTYVWQFSPTVRITAVISNESFVGGASPNMTAYTPGTFAFDGLNLIYSGNNLPQFAGSKGVANSGMATTNGGQVTFDIDVKVAILINGVYTDVVYPGMVIADAESIDSGGEYLSGDTPNPVAWQLLNKRVQGNAADDHYKMDLSNGGRSFKLYADLPPGNFGVQAVMFAHGARNLNNVSMRGSGITAMAVGFVLPFDLGDDPSSYGVAGHYMDQFQITDYYPGDGTYAVVNYNTTPLIAQATVYIGANNVDPDGQPVGTALANNDDIVGNADESTINPAALPNVKVNQANNVVLSVPVTNGKGVPATLYGWIDFNNDGVFAPDEVVSVSVPANTNNQTFTLTFLNSTFTNKLKVGTLYCRLRLTTTPLIDDPATAGFDERSTSFAADGEAEDYKLNDIIGVNISGTVFDDHNGGLDGSISGTPIQAVSGQQLYAYLIDNTNTIINSSTVAANGGYVLPNSNNGTYTVAISTNNVAIGGNLSAVVANLPADWKPSGETFGVNNAGNSGIQPGAPNLQIQVSTPGTSLDVSGVNFGLNQVPVTAPDAGTTTIGIPVTIDVPANDSDPDGTIDPTKVLLIDPADNVKKTSVTIPAQGTFTVNTTTGKVTFTPIATFTGKSIVSYTIKDDYGSESLNALITASVKPVGTNDGSATAINTPVTTDLKANDGPSAISTIVNAGTLPLHGTIVVNSSGTITYTPNTGYTGPDTYTYTLTTADGVVSDPITVTIITNPGVTPTGLPDADVTLINTAVTTTVISNDPSFNATSTIAISSPPVNGAAVVVNASAGTVLYTPANGFTGKDTYTYTLTNGSNISAPITVTISVKPVGVTDADVTTIATPVTTTVKINDTPTSTPLTVAAATAPTHGSIVVNASGTITYTPSATYIGKDVYTYTLTTPDGVVSDQVTVNMSIKPVGVPDADATPINTAVTTTVKANDGASATGTTVASITAPTHGNIVVNANGTIKYTPFNNYIGKDTYTYTLTTADGVISDPITVTISVKPVGTDDAGVTPINTAVTTIVKTNDGASATGTTVAVATPPANGSVIVNALGSITYTPNTGYTGSDSYTYTLTTADGVVSAPIVVTIAVGNKPVGVNDASSTPINTLVTTTVTSNDPSASGSTVAILSPPAHGAAVVTNASTGTVAYTPANNYVGKDTYTYTLTKAGIVSDPITVNISVKPVGVNDNDATPVNTAVTTAVKNNDGVANTTGTTVVAATAPINGNIIVNPSGTITYTPVTGYIGTDTYTYTLNTADGVSSDPIQVTVTVSPKPVGTNDVVSTPVNTTTTTNIAANDADGSGSTITLLSLPAHGTAALTSPSAGTVTYTPTTNYTGKDSYTYTLTKAGVVSDPITVSISVIPVGVADVDATPVNTAVTTIVKTNDGPSAIGTTVLAQTAPTHGSIIVNASGGITYTPNTGYTGSDSYTYALITADGVVSNAIPVTITVAPKPTGANDVDAIPINTAVTTTVTTNDPSAAGSTIAVLGAPAHGTAVVVNATAGTVAYTPANGFIGKDTYTYTLINGGIVSDPITVTISVKPVGVNDVDQTPVNTAVTTTVKTNDGTSGTGTTVTAGILPAHGSIVVNVSGTITYTPTPGYTGTDSYTYTLTTPDGVISDPIPVTISIYTASMTLTKVANNGGSKVGDVISYTLMVTNTGTSDITNVIVADAGADAGSITPANIATLTAGASATVTVKHTLVAADIGAGQYSNQASVTGKDIKGNTVTKSKSDDPSTPAVDDPTIVLITSPGFVSLNKTGVLLSNVITYTFVMKNIGTVPLTSVRLTDVKVGLNNIPITIPAGGLLPGASVSYDFVYTLTSADRDLGAISNTATVNAKDAGANTITATASVITTVPKSPTASNDAEQVALDKPTVIPILSNDNTGNTISLNPATVEIVTQPAHGTVVVNVDGTVTYTPTAGYAGTDVFTYRVKDIFGYYTNIATVTLTDTYLGALIIPTLFTPNGDGVNDVFEIRNLGLFAQNELTIVNRWGNEVYKQAGYKNTWTGNGLNEGTYYYLLRVKTTDGADWQVYKGYITLMRVVKK